VLYVKTSEKDNVYEEILMDEVNVKQIKYYETDLDVKDQQVEWSNGVGLDFEFNEELKREGLYNELARMIQVARKEAGCQMGEAVEMKVFVEDAELKGLVRNNANKVAADLKVKLEVVDSAEGLDKEYDVDGRKMNLKLKS
jgi:hypothetical protein